MRCTACQHVHKEPPPEDTRVERTVIVSQREESLSATVEVPADEVLGVGDEFVVETAEAVFAVRVTALEVGPDARVEEAVVREVETIWTRAVDNVVVDVTIHPSDGRREGTRSVEVGVPGDHWFVVGDEDEFLGGSVVVEGVLVRDDARGYPVRKVDRRGDRVAAKDAKRVYARDTRTRGWSGWAG